MELAGQRNAESLQHQQRAKNLEEMVEIGTSNGLQRIHKSWLYNFWQPKTYDLKVIEAPSQIRKEEGHEAAWEMEKAYFWYHWASQKSKEAHGSLLYLEEVLKQAFEWRLEIKKSIKTKIKCLGQELRYKVRNERAQRSLAIYQRPAWNDSKYFHVEDGI